MTRVLMLGAATAAVLVSPLLLALLALAGGATDEDLCTPDQNGEVAGLDAEQVRNAGIIMTVGQAAGVSPYGLQIALATAKQESDLRNIDYGDRDSLGLFQQRPSQGWGTPSQVQDPVYAAQAFFGGPTGPNNGAPPGLLDIDGWEQMPLTVAAQAVQLSAYPDAYAQWETAAADWLSELLPGAGDSCTPGGGLVCPPTALAAEDGLTPDALRVLRCIASEFPQISIFHGVGDRANESDHPSGRAVDAMIPDWATPDGNALGWEVAEWVRHNHVCLGVTYVIWDATIWSADRADEGWRPYQHPSGSTDANAAHLNHVHVSVHGDSGSCADGAWVVPLAGEYTITARFGADGVHWANAHTGVDLAAPLGRPVLGAAGGQVTYSGWDGAYGLKVEITHVDGTRTWYAHLSVVAVAVGAEVFAGDVIGQVGSTGNSTGPHLHFEVRPSPQGLPVDPEPWMAARGAPL
jgi:hypothetical protein